MMDKLGSLSPTALIMGESEEEKEIHKLAKEINEAQPPHEVDSPVFRPA